MIATLELLQGLNELMMHVEASGTEAEVLFSVLTLSSGCLLSTRLGREEKGQGVRAIA